MIICKRPKLIFYLPKFISTNTLFLIMNKLSCQLSSSVWPKINDFNYYNWAEHVCRPIFNYDFHEIHIWDVSRVDFYVPKVLFALKTALAISSNSASLLGFNKIKALITEKTTKIPPLMSGDEN